MSDKAKKILVLVAVLILLAGTGAALWFAAKPLIEIFIRCGGFRAETFAAWKAQFAEWEEAFRLWLAGCGFWGKAAFTGIVILQIVVAFIPGEPLETAAGYAFGAWEGLLLCEIGILAGSAIVFWFVRKFGVKVVRIFFPPEKIRDLKFLQKTDRLRFITFLIFFIPGTPKDLLCYFMGLTPIRFADFLIISAVARIPSVITSTLAGSALGSKNYLQAAIVFGVTLIVSLVGIRIYNVIVKKRADRAEEKESAPPAAGAGETGNTEETEETEVSAGAEHAAVSSGKKSEPQ